MSLDQAGPAGVLRRLADRETRLGEDAPDVRETAFALSRQLESLPTASVFDLLDGASDTQEGYWACIQAIRRSGGPEIVPKCSRWSNDPSALRRRASADILAQLGFGKPDHGRPFADVSEPIVVRLLGDQDTNVVCAALFACGQLEVGEPALLLPFATHAEPDIRHAASHAISWRTDPISVAAQVSLSSDPDRDTRNWATFYLANCKADMSTIRDALAVRLGDADPEIRGEALIGLAMRRDARVRNSLAVELAGEFHGAWCINAARELQDPAMIPLLVSLKGRLEPANLESFGSEIQEAIELCSTAAQKTESQ